MAGAAKFSADCGKAGAAMTDWNSSHSDTKPLSGGKAEMEALLRGRISRSRHAVDEPAHRLEIAPARHMQHGAGAQEKQDLNQEWFRACRSAAAIATAAAAGCPLARKASARPSATKITPTFSTVE